MKRLYLAFCSAVMIAAVGCHSKSAPQFDVSDDTRGLIRAAQRAVQDELESSFGTPSNLVVWPQLNVDFGSYVGAIEKVNSRAGVMHVDLQPTDGSILASAGRLASLRGSAFVLEGDAQSVFRVRSYDPAQGTLELVDEAGNSTTPDVASATAVTVIGDGLQRGRDLYLRHCVHCHGTSGDGNGPTAQYLTPRPRDYRKGIFKFTSTRAGVRASRDDLYRLVKMGVTGTYMPSFMLLPDDEVRAIVEYVRWLAMRGEMEGKLTANIKIDYARERLKEESADVVDAEFQEYVKSDIPDILVGIGEELASDWRVSEESNEVVLPIDEAGNPVKRVEPTAESIARGRAIFMGEKAKCYSCHGETARGNGPATEEINKLPGTEQLADKPGLFDAWGQIVKPRDLTRGQYRGGRRPLDIYRRVYAGIKGTPMQAFGGKGLSEKEIWDVVNYVMNVPFERR